MLRNLKRFECYKKRYHRRWHLDEMYIKIKGKWKYLYRVIDERGNTVDFYLFHRRNTIAVERFLKKRIKSNSTNDLAVINTDKNPTNVQAIKELKQDGTLAEHVQHYKLNTIIIAWKPVMETPSVLLTQLGDFSP